MKDLLINHQGDLVFNDQDLLLIDSTNEIAQSVKIIVETKLGEFFLDMSMGLSHVNMLGKNLQLDYLKQDITEAILTQESRIKSIEKVVLEKEDNRNLRVSIVMTANDDSIETEVLLNA